MDKAGAMEFDRSVCRLQGSLLGYSRPLSDVEVAQNLSKVVAAAEERQLRKLFVCLMLNCDDERLAELRLRRESAHLGDLFLLKRCVFLDVVDRNALWPFFREGVQTEDLPAVRSLIGMTVELGYLRDDAEAFVMAASAVIRARRSAQAELLDELSTLVSKLTTLQEKTRTSRSMFEILYLLLLSTTDDGALLGRAALNRFIAFTEPLGPSIVGPLCDRFVAIAKNLSVASWCDMTDESTEGVFSLSGFEVWLEGGIVPSNVQLLASHYAYLVVGGLDAESEAAAAMGHFAKKYDPAVELKLDEKTVDEVLDDLELVADVPWKVRAYFDHLCGGEAWETTKSCQRAMAAVEKHRHLASPAQCRRFFDELASGAEDISTVHLLRSAFLDSAVRVLDAAGARDLLRLRLQCLERGGAFRRESFVTEVRRFLNKTVDDPASWTEKEMVLLAMQSPLELCRLLVEDCLNSAGKMAMFPAFSAHLDDVFGFKRGSVRFFTELVLQNLKGSKLEGDRLLHMVETGVKTSEAAATDLSTVLLERLVGSEIRDDETTAALPLLEVSLAASKFSDPEAKIAALACVCHLASKTYEQLESTARRQQNLRLLLRALNGLTVEDDRQETAKVIETCLHPELRPYFIPDNQRSFSRRLKSSLFAGERCLDGEHHDESDARVQLLAVLPDLIPDLCSRLVHCSCVSRETLLRSMIVLMSLDLETEAFVRQTSFMAQEMKPTDLDADSAATIFRLLCQLYEMSLEKAAGSDVEETSPLGMCLINFADGLLQLLSESDSSSDPDRVRDKLMSMLAWLCTIPESTTRSISLSKFRMLILGSD